MNPLGAVILAIALLLVLFASRPWAIMGVMGSVLYLTQGQYLQLGGINIYAIRFVELAGFIRVIARREFSLTRLHVIDKALLLLLGYSTTVFVLRSNINQVNAIGTSTDALLSYFTFRGLVRDENDFRWFLSKFLLLLTPYVGLLLIERLSGSNPFTAMGGIQYGGWIRDGKLRCQGSFRQASLLGTLGACFLPLYIGLWPSKVQRKAAVFGIVLCLTIVWASNSGGPLTSTAVGICGWALWKFRTKMKLFRLSAVFGFIVLALLMDAPVWYLVAKVSSVSGGSGWHRAHLMDMAFKHLDLWWFSGMDVKDTGDWFPYVLSITGGADITNQYLLYGIDAGLLAMFLFIGLLVLAFRNISKALRVALSGETTTSTGNEPLIWGMGVMLAIHCVNWLSITYFDQTYVVWYFQLAVIASLTISPPKSEGDN